MTESNKARVIAFYLPQFHPTPENDEWWGKGFTEWANVSKAKPLFKGHYQPHFPADLGYYDLRVPEVREAQAEMARAHGIEGFCYWHYWFGNGRRILERVFNEVLESGKPDFPFCLGWANESWTGVWHGNPGSTLIQQTYPGEEDHKRHFDFLLRAFADPRYIRVHGKPVFMIYNPQALPDCPRVIDLWRNMADRAGLPGLHFVAHCSVRRGLSKPGYDPSVNGFDAYTSDTVGLWANCRPVRMGARLFKCVEGMRGVKRVQALLNPGPDKVFLYRDAIEKMILQPTSKAQYYPMAMPNWDNTPRSGVRGWVLHESSPELFRVHLKQVLGQVAKRDPQTRIVFLKSWNEWAEGNYLEPDKKTGHGYLEVVRDEVEGSVPA